MIKLHTSYSILSDSVLLKLILINKIITYNVDNGLNFGIYMFGKYIIYSNTHPLNDRSTIISSVYRDGFEVIDLDNKDVLLKVIKYVENDSSIKISNNNNL